MSFYKKLEQLFKNFSINPEKIILGHQIIPLKIFNLTDFFPKLNLRKEEIILGFLNQGNFTGLLTNQFYYAINQEPISLKDCNEEHFKVEFSKDEVDFIFKSIDIFTDIKQKIGKNLDDFLHKYKDIVKDKEEIESQPHFDLNYLEMLSHEAQEALNFCKNLNADARFSQALNMIFAPGDQAIDGYKAEHLLLSDLIKSYNFCKIENHEKAHFTLAYFFEKLQGNDLAKSVSIGRLNEMVSKPAFSENIKKIKEAQFFSTPKEYEDNFILPQILSKMYHESFAKSGNIIYRFATLIVKADGTINEEEKGILKSILQKTTQSNVKKSNFSKEIPENDSLEKVLEEMNTLVGLEEVKKSVQDLINFLKISKIRENKEMPKLDISLHAVFLGPPGTGKTTIARLLGRIYKHLDYLSQGQLVETDRAGMVAGYVGQTAIKVDELVTQSIGGVLFIDEAYALTPADNTRDFGSEAVDTLIKRMEDHREDLVVVVAGYTEPMNFFIESNPGLRSRFNRYFKFDHFYPNQLLDIFIGFCNKYDFILTDDAKDKLSDTFEMLYEKRDEGFGNARVVRNLFEICTQNQANRLILLAEINEEILQTITDQDVPEPKITLEKVYLTQPKNDEQPL
jgi:stage V sporulation protein K